MLQVGRLGCSASTHGCAEPQLINWTRTHFASFAIISSPLVLSVIPTDEVITPLLDIIGNKQAMAINQAWVGHPGTLVRNLPPVDPPSPSSLPPPSTSSSGGTTTTFTLAKAEQATLNGCQIYDNTEPVYLRSGSVTLFTSAILDLKLSPGTITGVSFDYQYITGYTGTTGANFTLEVAGTSAYASPLLNKYPYNNKQYSPPVAVAANGLSIAVPSSGGAVEFKFHNLDKNIQIELPLQISITCAGSSPCFTHSTPVPPSPPPVAGIQLWAKPIGDGKVAALFINGGSVAYPPTKISLKELNISTTTVYSDGHGDADVGSKGVAVTDVWTGEDAGPVSAGQWSTGEVPPMDSKFVVFDAGSASF